MNCLSKKKRKRCDHACNGYCRGRKPVKTQPALDFITQPANEAVQQKVQESLERLHHKSEPVAQVETAEVEPQEKAEFVRSYVFTGRAGTISAVQHTKAAMTLAKAPDEESKPFPIVKWTESRYYFNGKGAAAIIVQLAIFILKRHKQNQSNILTIKTEPVGSVFILCIFKT